MRLKKALIELGYRQEELRPHLRVILDKIASDSNALFGVVRELERRPKDLDLWEEFVEEMDDWDPETGQGREISRRMKKIREKLGEVSGRLEELVYWASLAQYAEDSEGRLGFGMERLEGPPNSGNTIYLAEDGSAVLQPDLGSPKGYATLKAAEKAAKKRGGWWRT